jgi:hypothetical protein
LVKVDLVVTNPLTVQQVMNHGSRVLVKYEVVVVLVDVVTIVEKVYLAEIILVQVVDEVEIITTVLLGEMVELVQVDILEVVARQQFLITTLVNLVLAVAAVLVLVETTSSWEVEEELVSTVKDQMELVDLSVQTQQDLEMVDLVDNLDITNLLLEVILVVMVVSMVVLVVEPTMVTTKVVLVLTVLLELSGVMTHFLGHSLTQTHHRVLQ